MTTAGVPVEDQPDLEMVYAIHGALTQDVATLVAAIADLEPEDRAERIPTIRRFFGCYTNELVSHHTHEDVQFFPALEAKVGPQAMARDELDAQHHGLDDAARALRSALDAVGNERTEFASSKRRTVEAGEVLAALVVKHLDLEERVAFPLYQREVSVAEHQDLETKAQSMDPFEHLFFFVPWLFDRLPPPVREGALGAAPEVFRVVYTSHVQQYRRLVRSLVPETGHDREATSRG